MPQATLTISPDDWGKLFTGAAALGGFIFGVIKWLLARATAKIIESRESLESQFMSMLKEALIAKAERAGHGRTRVIDITFVSPHGPDNEIRLPVILGEWLTVLPGTDIMGEEFAADRTSYLLKIDGTSFIRDHKHRGTESVLVIKGSMRDRKTGRNYYPGELWVIPENDVHSVHFEIPADNSSHGLFLITVRPALPSTSQVSLSLAGMSDLA